MDKSVPRIIVLSMMLLIGSACSDSSSNSPARTSTPTEARNPNSAPAKTSLSDSFGDGTKVVGTDIKPGTYRTRTRAPGCYWARLAGFSGELRDILANGNDSGPVVVTIKPGDIGFECRQCGIWTTDLSPITTAQGAPFNDGVFIVNVDIAPGTWRTDDSESCYWARLRGFTGALGDIISNANGKGIVTIAKTDKGFKSTGCGTWSKIK